ncbi:4-hydroxy-tetrahydrodipicolinate synthase [Salinarchaeum chitinilyticum]
MTADTHSTDDPFRGVYPAMVTPFAEGGSIDYDQLRSEARRLEAAGVDGLVPVGSTGESATLSHDEHVDVVEAVVDAVEDVPVIAGTGSNNTREALELSHAAADVGADALLLISPYYNKPEQRGLEAHFREIADAIDLPQIVYNVPSRTGQNVEPDTVVNLADHPNVAGYKAASGDLGQVTEVVERTREYDFSVLSGDDALTLPMCSVGATGTISVAANVEPERTVAMVHSALGGANGERAPEYDTARELHHELGPLFRELFVETNPIPVKEAVAMRGHCEPTIRPPLSRLAEEHREPLRELLDELEATREESLANATFAPTPIDQ